MPLRELVAALYPQPPHQVQKAAQSLGYRGLITVNLIINRAFLFPDHWIYIHERSVRVGRIGNMNNFSISMSANPNHTVLGLEYFAFHNEAFWQYDDAKLISLAREELATLGIADSKEVIDGFVLRVPQAYPVYDASYKTHLDCVLQYLRCFTNLELMGRNGLHRYNNMDQAMLSAFAAVVRVQEKEQRVPQSTQQQIVF